MALLAAGLLAGCAPPACRPMVSAQLFFGLTRPGGGVDGPAFAAFLDASVTPRFPAGLTVLDADGRWRRPDGALTQEPSKLVLVIAAPGPDTLARLQAIRAEYAARFDQQSVGMALSSVCADF
jgi:hypothetical protein